MKADFVKSFHGLRGLASMMVFVAHITGGYALHVGQVYSADLQKIITSVGTFGVEIFFVLSGYVILQSAQVSSERKFFHSRFWRIYPVFALFTVLFFSMNAIFNVEPDKNNITYLVANLLFLDIFFNTPHLTPNAWSVTYEIWYYIITFYFVSLIFRKKLGVLTLASIPFAAYFIINHPITIYFVMGMLLKVAGDHIAEINKKALFFLQTTSVITLLLLLCSGISFASNGWAGLLNNWIELLLPVSLGVAMFTLIRSEGVTVRFFESKNMMLLGTISYSLYLLHPYTYLASRYISTKISFFHGDSFFTFATFILISTVSTLVCSYLLNRYYESKIFRMMTHRQIYNPNAS